MNKRIIAEEYLQIEARKLTRSMCAILHLVVNKTIKNMHNRNLLNAYPDQQMD